MSIISQETWDKMPEKEKQAIIKDYQDLISDNGVWREDMTTEERNGAIQQIEWYFGKENLQPKPEIKTWEDVIMSDKSIFDLELNPDCGNPLICCLADNADLAEKISNKCQATIKIAKLIELGYGGMVTEEENSDTKIKKYAPFYYGESGFVIECLYRSQDRVLCFHTQQQAEEFMSYPENVELVKQYHMA